MEILIPDLKATRALDFVWLQLKRTIRNAAFVLDDKDTKPKDKKEAQGILDTAQKSFDEYKTKKGTPQIVIGCISPRKMTSLRHGRYVLSRDKFEIEKATAEELDAWSESARVWVRWGVKGLADMGFEYEAEKESCGPVVYDVTSWETVEVLEALGLLDILFTEIMDFNTLDESKKKTS